LDPLMVKTRTCRVWFCWYL